MNNCMELLNLSMDTCLGLYGTMSICMGKSIDFCTLVGKLCVYGIC